MKAEFILFDQLSGTMSQCDNPGLYAVSDAPGSVRTSPIGKGRPVMATILRYTVDCTWSGGRLGRGRLTGESLSTELSVPVNLGGPGIGTCPEELLLGAAAGCYLITLSTLLANRHVPVVRIDLESRGFVEDDRGLRFDRIEHHPTIILESPVDEHYIITLAEHAEHACMVSSALRGNVQVKVYPSVEIQTKSGSRS
jgi:peroxiredoxin-like protein